MSNFKSSNIIADDFITFSYYHFKLAVVFNKFLKWGKNQIIYNTTLSKTSLSVF